MRYVAFLRGINVGKHRRITMDELKQAFDAAGYKNVSTYIASGNVIFDAGPTDSSALTTEVEARLEKALGYRVDVIVRSADEYRGLVAADPFKGFERTDQIRLNVTFVDGDGGAAANSPEVPGFRILSVSDDTVFSVLNLSEIGTRDVMTVLEKAFGKRITTRTWKVIQEINSRYLTTEVMR